MISKQQKVFKKNLSMSIDYNPLLIHIKQKSSLKIKQGHRSWGLRTVKKCVGKPVFATPPPRFWGKTN
jgi:hypothetical protein